VRPLNFTVRLLVKRFLVFGTAALATAIAVAGPPPNLPVHILDTAASLKNPATRGLTLGALNVSFEETTLSDVLRVASAGSITHSGKGGESIFSVCFTDADSQSPSRLWIISSAEMGGDSQEVTQIAAIRLARGSPTADCPLLPDALKPISLDAGLWLGSPHRDLVRAFGSASHTVGGWEAHRYSGKVPGSCEGGFDVMNWIAAKTQQDRVTAIYAGQITSC
jgi:hypothetical protein